MDSPIRPEIASAKDIANYIIDLETEIKIYKSELEGIKARSQYIISSLAIENEKLELDIKNILEVINKIINEIIETGTCCCYESLNNIVYAYETKNK